MNIFTHARIVLLGPPGAGKGTQGDMLASALGLPRLSVGALIRRHYHQQTPEGEQVGEYMVKGHGIPAGLLFRILDQWFIENPKGFVVDNLVRTQEQLDELKVYQKTKNFTLDKVFYLNVSEETAIARLSKRSREKTRPDETPEAIDRRFKVFYEEFSYIREYFNTLGIFEEVNAEQSIEAVHKILLDRVHALL